jgi:hypothetical protein
LRADRSLGERPDAGATFSIRSPQSHGKAAGEWMAAGCPGEHPSDQRLDDGGALVFETPLLLRDIAVLGTPRLRLRIAADVRIAQVAVRLSEVMPDGRALRVSYQVLNLTHRDSHEHPQPLEPGVAYDIDLTMNVCGHRFMAGDRIRLSIASAYWPTVWPAPYSATLTLQTGASALELPVRRADAGPSVSFPAPVHGPRTPMTRLDPGVVRRYSVQDHVSGETTYVTDAVGGVFGEGVLRLDAIDVEVAQSLKRELRIRDDDPLSARSVVTQSYALGREGWRTIIDTRAELSSDRENFYLSGVLTARLNGELVAERRWSETFARDLI